ncbi:methionine ABC transporter ATP-binding protein [Pseudomonas sp. KNUC1026]|uniref:methionine ABC transporter ATP-binding protein n=1 Tax=Pseudomonas sp. KNUC1026 TaxID=2893890 RepID=UPI001F365039|nr:ATP-binding cassette domain-containing protein [Pseudomonas sp. KNUC1026]UFH50412.1 ATP-binding cassette domain-containing protein [Pseudomonas sp. KNUC1026]
MSQVISLRPAVLPSVEPPALPARAEHIRLQGVSKAYDAAGGPVEALRGIDLSIGKGEIFGIIGRSGAGKSSLIRTLNRLEEVSAGHVLIDGQDIGVLGSAQLVQLRRRIGMIFQHFNLLASQTVLDNLALPLKAAGVGRAVIEQLARELLKLVGLEGKEHVYPSRLSGGQKQRVGIARALMLEPSLLLCDEATSALDPETTQSILALLKHINATLGLTIVLITHEMAVIRQVCDRVAVLEQGQVVEQGPVWKIFGQPATETTRALLAPLATQVPPDIAERLANDSGQRTVLELTFDGQTAREPDLAAIAQQLGGSVALLHGSIERIQGRAQGRLLLAVEPAPGRLEVFLRQQGLFSQARVAGHV